MSIPYSYRRILRRELHSPRSVLAISVAFAVIVLCVYVGTEIVLAMLNHRALLAAPQDMLAALSALGSTPVAVPITVGVILAVVGVLLIVAALTPGRRARHQLAADRAAVVVDDEVIASALARNAARVGNIDPDNTVVSVSAHNAEVHLTPATGTPVDREAVSDSVKAQLATFRLTPSVRSSVVIATRGKVGA
jgi:Family of unknown function (DUF6286)